MKRKFLWILFVFFFAASASATCPELGDEYYDPNCQDLDMPLDSGVGLLIGAAAFYTVKRIRKKNDSKP
jgi:hypothetical protein